MKIRIIYIVPLLVFILSSSSNLFSQRINVIINPNTNYSFKLTFNGFEIFLDSKGLINDWNIDCDGTIKSNYQNDRLEGLGSIGIEYDSQERIKSIGGLALSYDKENRLLAIGDLKIIYNAYNAEVEKIGDKAISYTRTSRKLEKIGNSLILYDYYERITGFSDKEKIFKFHPAQKSLAKEIRDVRKKGY